MSGTTMRAVVVTGQDEAGVRDVPKQMPGAGEVRVKIHFAALNPADYKNTSMVRRFPQIVGTVLGCDWAGTVDAVGEGVTESLQLHEGDRVAGVVHGGNPLSPYPNGAFAEYVVVDASLVYRVPEHVPLEVCAAQTVAAISAGQMIWQTQDLPTPTAPGDYSTDFIVWSGATAVGQWLIQLAHLSGMRVIVTASPRHHERLRAMGAAEVLDYRAPDVGARIRELTHGKLAAGGVCEISAEHVPALREALSDDGAVLSSIVLVPAGLGPNHTVKMTFAYTTQGKRIETPLPLPAMPDHYEKGKIITKTCADLLAAGKIQPVPHRIFGDLDSIPNAFEEMKQGKVSGERLVFRIQ